MADAQPATTTGSPSDFLRNVVGQKVSVKLNSGVSYQGQSVQLDTWTLANADNAPDIRFCGIASASD